MQELKKLINETLKHCGVAPDIHSTDNICTVSLFSDDITIDIYKQLDVIQIYSTFFDSELAPNEVINLPPNSSNKEVLHAFLKALDTDITNKRRFDQSWSVYGSTDSTIKERRTCSSLQLKIKEYLKEN